MEDRQGWKRREEEKGREYEIEGRLRRVKGEGKKEEERREEGRAGRKKMRQQ